MKGVLLSLEDRDGAPATARLLCEVKVKGQPQGSAEVVARGAKVVTRMFPGDFTSAPSLPLHDGEYEVTWSRETNDGVGWGKVRTIIVERRGGRISAVLDEGGGQA
jgi:hypothetical protein